MRVFGNINKTRPISTSSLKSEQTAETSHSTDSTSIGSGSINSRSSHSSSTNRNILRSNNTETATTLTSSPVISAGRMMKSSSARKPERLCPEHPNVFCYIHPITTIHPLGYHCFKCSHILTPRLSTSTSLDENEWENHSEILIHDHESETFEKLLPPQPPPPPSSSPHLRSSKLPLQNSPRNPPRPSYTGMNNKSVNPSSSSSSSCSNVNKGTSTPTPASPTITNVLNKNPFESKTSFITKSKSTEDRSMPLSSSIATAQQPRPSATQKSSLLSTTSSIHRTRSADSQNSSSHPPHYGLRVRESLNTHGGNSQNNSSTSYNMTNSSSNSMSPTPVQISHITVQKEVQQRRDEIQGIFEALSEKRKSFLQNNNNNNYNNSSKKEESNLSRSSTNSMKKEEIKMTKHLDHQHQLQPHITIEGKIIVDKCFSYQNYLDMIIKKK